MRNIVRGALGALALGATAGPAAAVMEGDWAADTAGQLAAICSARGDADDVGRYATGACYGFIEGAGQFYEAVVTDERFRTENVICPTRAVSRTEVADYFVRWVAADPARAALAPIPALIMAGKEAFPCPE